MPITADLPLDYLFRAYCELVSEASARALGGDERIAFSLATQSLSRLDDDCAAGRLSISVADALRRNLADAAGRAAAALGQRDQAIHYLREAHSHAEAVRFLLLRENDIPGAIHYCRDSGHDAMSTGGVFVFRALFRDARYDDALLFLAGVPLRTEGHGNLFPFGKRDLLRAVYAFAELYRYKTIDTPGPFFAYFGITDHESMSHQRREAETNDKIRNQMSLGPGVMTADIRDALHLLYGSWKKMLDAYRRATQSERQFALLRQVYVDPKAVAPASEAPPNTFSSSAEAVGAILNGLLSGTAGQTGINRILRSFASHRNPEQTLAELRAMPRGIYLDFRREAAERAILLLSNEARTTNQIAKMVLNELAEFLDNDTRAQLVRCLRQLARNPETGSR